MTGEKELLKQAKAVWQKAKDLRDAADELAKLPVEDKTNQKIIKEMQSQARLYVQQALVLAQKLGG